MGADDYNYNEAHNAADFSDLDTRKNFSKKVLALTGLQLLITFSGVTAASVLASESYGLVQIGHGIFAYPLIWASMVCSITLLVLGVCCCTSVLRKSPHNMIFLFTWTLFETHLVSACALKYDPKTVALAGCATAISVLVVAALVAFTKFDFSKLLPIMGAILICWMFVLIFSMIFGVSWNRTLYGCIGVAIFMVFLAVDLKMMLGGGKYQYSEDDYVLAAINIYLDIINIFLYMLEIFNN